MAAYYREEEFLDGTTLPITVSQEPLYQGDTVKITAHIQSEDGPVDLAGGRVKLTYRNSAGETKITRDSGAEPATITLESAADGSAEKPRLTWTLLGLDTATLTPGAYSIEGVFSDDQGTPNKTHIITGSVNIQENHVA